MNNLFDFATKELSQDAFLCWLISNCKGCDNKELKKVSYDFVNKITGFGFDIDCVKEVEIKQQYKNMDIVVFFKNMEDVHYLLIIEDKIHASAGTNQLTKYNNEIIEIINNKSIAEENVKKVFFKADRLTEKDKSELQKANDKDGLKWISYDIEQIHEFFVKCNNTNSEIMDSYIEHLKNLYEQLNNVSKNNVNDWNYIEARTYFDKIIRDKFLADKKDKYFVESNIYQGRYLSYLFYYICSNDSFKVVEDDNKYPNCAYPMVELIFRNNSDYLLFYTHIAYHSKKGEWTWKCAKYDGTAPVKDYLNELKAKLYSYGVKTRSMKSEKAQTISSEKTKKCNVLDFENEIIKYLDKYDSAFKKLDLRQI